MKHSLTSWKNGITKPKWRLLAVIGFLLTVSAVVFFIRKGSAKHSFGGATKYKEVSVERGTFEIKVSASGVVTPIDRVEIKSKASGLIEQLPIEEGQVVRKDELIARLDQTDVRAEVEQAKADLEIAKAEVAQAQHIYDRRDQLFKQELISTEEKGEIELSLAQAKGNQIRTRTRLDQAQERLSETIVRSPVTGIILQKYVEEGQIIASGISNVSGGTPIADIAHMGSVHIEAGIDEIDIGKVGIGQPAVVTADAYPQLNFDGTIVRIAPEARIEQNVTLFDVIIEVDNTDGKLKSGMNATVEITIVRKEDVLLAPAMALRAPRNSNAPPNMRGTLLKQGDEFVRHRVKIGLADFKQVEIIDGLNEGDILGVAMHSRLMEDNERLERLIKGSRSFGSSGDSQSSKRRPPH